MPKSIHLGRWETAGAVFIVFAGSALHFVYEWLGEWRPAALIAAVNESTWEHLKLCFWPGLIWAGVEFPFFLLRQPNFLVAKAAGLLLMPIVIVVGFYGYTAIAGDNYLPADIGLFVIAVIAGQATSYAIMRLKPASQPMRVIAAIALLLETAAFSLLTFYPPKIFLFENPVDHGFGIPENVEQSG
jgi:hypothetical protein